MEEIKAGGAQLYQYSPLVFDIGLHSAAGYSVGFLLGTFFFKNGSTRRFLSRYGFGFGVGLNVP